MPNQFAFVLKRGDSLNDRLARIGKPKGRPVISPWDPEDLRPRADPDNVALDICDELIRGGKLSESQQLALELVVNGYRVQRDRLARIERAPHNED